MSKYSKEFKIKIIHHYLAGNEGLSITLRLVVMVLVAMGNPPRAKVIRSRIFSIMTSPQKVEGFKLELSHF
jgi:hypothetical protein